jgi:hypothetical protein
MARSRDRFVAMSSSLVVFSLLIAVSVSLSQLHQPRTLILIATYKLLGKEILLEWFSKLLQEKVRVSEERKEVLQRIMGKQESSEFYTTERGARLRTLGMHMLWQKNREKST